MKLGELATEVGAVLLGDPERSIEGAAGIEEAKEGDVTFFANARYRSALGDCAASAVLLDSTAADDVGEIGPARLVHPNPYAAFAMVLDRLNPTQRIPAGVSGKAVVEDGAEVDPAASVLSLAYIGAGARIGPRTVVHPHCYVGPDAVVGADCVLYPGVVIREKCLVGDRVILQPGVRLGGDGFGFALDQSDSGPFHRKVPQVGIVRVEDDVEMGAGSCVDRATTGETVIGRGSKIDNLVQIGHNVVIGPMSIVCGQTGIAGSARIGAGVVLAGQVGIVNHVRVGDGATLAAGAAVSNDVPPGATWSGRPAYDHKKWLRATTAVRKLPDLIRRVRKLERS